VRTPRRLPESLEPREVAAFTAGLATCRDRAMVLLMLLGGLRAGEVRGLRLANVDMGLRRVRVLGKGGRERVVPVDPAFFTELAAYLRGERPHGCAAPECFVVLRGPTAGRALTEAGMRRVFRTQRDSPGAGRVRPHRLRHTYGTGLADAGIDLLLSRHGGRQRRNPGFFGTGFEKRPFGGAEGTRTPDPHTARKGLATPSNWSLTVRHDTLVARLRRLPGDGPRDAVLTSITGTRRTRRSCSASLRTVRSRPIVTLTTKTWRSVTLSGSASSGPAGSTAGRVRASRLDVGQKRRSWTPFADSPLTTRPYLHHAWNQSSGEGVDPVALRYGAPMFFANSEFVV